MIWIAHPRIASQVPQIKAALLKLTPATTEGAQFLDATGYVGIRELATDEMKELTPYANALKEVLKR